MSYILLSGQASPLDPQCLICLRERLTYSVVDLDAPDGVESRMGVGLENRSMKCRQKRSFTGGWEQSFIAPNPGILSFSLSYD